LRFVDPSPIYLQALAFGSISEDNMAVTNHPKDQNKAPVWAQRGKLRLAHVEGGPSRTAEMLMLDGWDSTPVELLSTCRYHEGLIDELLKKKINAVCLTWAVGFSHEGDQPQWEMVKKLLPLLKKKKIKAIAQIGLTSCFTDEVFRRVPDAKNWLYVDEEGNTNSWNQTERCSQMDIMLPEWREFIAHKVKAAIEAGFDGLFFDNVLSGVTDSAKFLKELYDTARAARSDGEEILFYTHASFFDALNRVANFKWKSSGHRPDIGADGMISTNIGFLKTLFEEGGRDKPFASGIHFGALTPKEARVAVAEVFATGGVCTDSRAPIKYQEFHADNAALFAASDPVGSVGLLIHDAASWVDSIYASAPIASVLAGANIQFDIIPSIQYANFDFRKYRVLVVAHLRQLSDGLIGALETFMRHQGGTVLASLDCKRVDAKGKETESPVFIDTKDLKGDRIEKEFGKGKLTLFAPLERSDDRVKEARDFKARLLPYFENYISDQPIRIDAPPGVVALMWGKNTKRWIHVLNYRAEPSDAAILLPSCGGREITLHSPDEQQPTLNVVETGNARVAFTLNGLDSYAIVEVV
jgi:hypothetical protein